jgi:hypothetical protein
VSELRKARPMQLASVRRHVMDHVNDVDLGAFTGAMQRCALAARAELGGVATGCMDAQGSDRRT